MRAKPTRRKKPVMLKGPPYEPCGECCNGWIYLKNGYTVNDPVIGVRRCWCWTSWRAKAEEYSRASVAGS